MTGRSEFLEEEIMQAGTKFGAKRRIYVKAEVHLRRRVGSSMVEQWPFKPLVAGSSPARLIMKNHFCNPG